MGVVIQIQVCKMWVKVSCKRGNGVITAKSSFHTNLAEEGGRGVGILTLKKLKHNKHTKELEINESKAPVRKQPGTEARL